MKVIAIITLQVDGKTILPGKSVDIANEEAQSLIDRGFAQSATKETTAAPETSKTPPPPPPPPASLDDIIEAIDQLNPETDFAQSGKPKVEAIEAVLGQNINADTRDKAWELYQKEVDTNDGGGDGNGDDDQTNGSGDDVQE